jgi:predicted lysophospholipase L1 biosynthesis ABC-type transport system permease subunit
VTEGYFAAMGIAVQRGRAFARSDSASAPPVVVVDRRLAATFWPGESPLGRRIYEPQSGAEALEAGPSTRYLTVVGVVEDVKAEGLVPGGDAVGAYYTPLAQSPTRAFAVVARSGEAPDALGRSIRDAIRAVDPALPVFDVSTMAARLDASLVPRRLPMMLSIAFAGIALFLSAIGVYGVLAWTVAERRREIGLRMALGSTTQRVFRLMLADGLSIVLPGLAIGLVTGWAAARAMRGLLFGVQPFDPTVVASVAGVIAVVAFLAVFVPARRAMRISPMVSLKG